MYYRGMTLSSFIDRLMETLKEKPVVYRKGIDQSAIRYKARTRAMIEWYVQQPYEVQKNIYDACMCVSSRIDNIGPQGALDLVLMTAMKYG